MYLKWALLDLILRTINNKLPPSILIMTCPLLSAQHLGKHLFALEQLIHLSLFIKHLFGFRKNVTYGRRSLKPNSQRFGAQAFVSRWHSMHGMSALRLRPQGNIYIHIKGIYIAMYTYIYIYIAIHI